MGSSFALSRAVWAPDCKSAVGRPDAASKKELTLSTLLIHALIRVDHLLLGEIPFVDCCVGQGHCRGGQDCAEEEGRGLHFD